MTIRAYLTRKQNYELTKLLESIVIKKPDNFCEYEDGWNDARVAKELGITTVVPVQLTRLAIFGRLRPRRLPKQAPAPAALELELQDRITWLERQVKNIYKELGVKIVN